jgi:hypothetical protein
MKKLSVLVCASLFMSLAGCQNQSYYSDDYPQSRYPDKYTRTDITLFDSGLTNYHNYHGFDVFRQNGSFNNGRFYQ